MADDVVPDRPRVRDEARAPLAEILNVAASLARRTLCVDDACWTDRQDRLCVEYAMRLKRAHDQLRAEMERLTTETERLRESADTWEQAASAALAVIEQREAGEYPMNDGPMFEAQHWGRELDDLEAGRMMLELAEADQDEIERLETEIAGLKAEIQQWHGELHLARERIRALNAALAEAHGQILVMRTGPCDCPLCPDSSHGGERG